MLKQTDFGFKVPDIPDYNPRDVQITKRSFPSEKVAGNTKAVHYDVKSVLGAGALEHQWASTPRVQDESQMSVHIDRKVTRKEETRYYHDFQRHVSELISNAGTKVQSKGQGDKT